LTEGYLVDWTHVETSRGQQWIEAELAANPNLLGSRVLHVGVGNSAFAVRFAGQVELLDGLTVVAAEQRLAQTLTLENYRVRLLNKYAPRLPSLLGRSYDLIVDNNLTSYACCTHHFYRMLDHYWQLLTPGGSILTDQEGLAWRSDREKGWTMDYAQLATLAERFELAPARLTENVYRLTRDKATYATRILTNRDELAPHEPPNV
jgi:hypothetical protein